MRPFRLPGRQGQHPDDGAALRRAPSAARRADRPDTVLREPAGLELVSDLRDNVPTAGRGGPFEGPREGHFAGRVV
jgi:hypothetical protein